MPTKHVSVLLNESVSFFGALKNGGTIVDCTVGGGGHAEAFLSEYAQARLIGVDRDANALEVAQKRLKKFGSRVTLVEANFSELESVLDSMKVEKVDAIFADLGMSSFQLDDERRGFSFQKRAPLDMRMGLNTKSAWDVLNSYPEEEISRIIYEYGEERFSRRIAHRIVESRPVRTTEELSRLVILSMPQAARKRWKSTLRRVFQAIRIEVNDELENLKSLLEISLKRLKSGGRIAIISFHSLEDRMVKRAFMGEGFAVITKKPVIPSQLERLDNPKSRSAKLRVAEKV